MQPRTPSFTTLRTTEFKLSDWRGKLSSRLLMGRQVIAILCTWRQNGEREGQTQVSNFLVVRPRSFSIQELCQLVVEKTSRKSAHVSNLSLATTPLFQLQDLCQQFCSQCHTFCIRKESHACLHTFDTLWSLGQSVFPWVH